MTHVTHARMLKTRRKNQTRIKKIRRAEKRARRKYFEGKVAAPVKSVIQGAAQDPPALLKPAAPSPEPGA